MTQGRNTRRTKSSSSSVTVVVGQLAADSTVHGEEVHLLGREAVVVDPVLIVGQVGLVETDGALASKPDGVPGGVWCD